jgi:hypothetical protein
MGLLGFSFGFGARDEGMDQAMDNASRQLDALNGMLEHQSEIAERSSIHNLIGSLQSIQLAGIQGALDDLTGGTENVTTGLESAFTAFNQEARPFIAQLGLTGSEAAAARSEISSLAHSLNVGAGQVATAFQALELQGDGVRNAFASAGVGLRELVMAEQAIGIQSDQLIASIADLTKSYGFSEESVGGFLDVFTETAIQAGQGAVAFSQLQNQLIQLDNVLQSSQNFRDLSLEDQQRFVEQSILGTQRLAGALTNVLGVAPQQAQESAMAFSTALLQNQQSIENMMAGVEGEFGDLFTRVAQETGIDVSTAIVGATPDEAIRNLIAIRQQLLSMSDRGSAAVTRLDSALAQVDPGLNFGFLADAGEDAIGVMDELQITLEEAAGAFRELAEESHTTGRTLDEELGLIRDGFTTTLGQIGGGTGQFVSAQSNAYDEVTERIRALAGDDAWGPLTRRFALATRVGMSAFFTPMNRSSEQTEQMFSQMGSAIARGGFIGRMEAIRQLGVAGVFLDMGDAASDMASAVERAEEAANEMFVRSTALRLALSTFLPVIGGVTAALLSGMVIYRQIAPVFAVARAAVSLLIGPFGMLRTAIVAVGATIAGVLGWPVTIGLAVAAIIGGIALLPDEIQNKIADFLDRIRAGVDRATEFLSGIDGTEIANNLMDSLSELPGRISDFFVNLFSGAEYTDELSESAGSLGSSLLGALVEVFRVGGEFFSTLFSRIAEGFRSFASTDGQWLRDFGDSIQRAIVNFDLGGVIRGFFDNLFSKDNTDSAIEGIDWGSVLDTVFTFLFDAARAGYAVLAFIGDILIALVDALIDGVTALRQGLTELFFRALDAVGDLIRGAFSGLIETAFNGMYEAADHLPEGLAGPFRTALRFIAPIVQGMIGMFNTVTEGLIRFVNGLIRTANRVGQYIPGFGDGFSEIDTDTLNIPVPEFDFSGAERSGEEVVNGIAAGMKNATPAMVGATDAAAQSVVDMLPSSPPRDPSSPFHTLPSAGSNIMRSIAEGMVEGMVFITEAMTHAFALIEQGFMNSFAQLRVNVYEDFELMGIDASQAFARGVIQEQEHQIGNIRRDLNVLFDDMYSSITIREADSEAGSAVLEVDSIRAIVDSIKDMKDQVVVRLDSVIENTRRTADNTAGASLRSAPVRAGGV